MGRPLRDRRARLENVVTGSEVGLPVRRLANNGFAAWAEVIAHDYEGLVAKEEASLCEAGPTRRWLKGEAGGRGRCRQVAFGTLSARVDKQAVWTSWTERRTTPMRSPTLCSTYTELRKG